MLLPGTAVESGDGQKVGCSVCSVEQGEPQSLPIDTTFVASGSCTPDMSSSCVPPKSYVVHDPDPSGQDDESDTSSDCGSLCTCTSGSMASLATIDRVPDRPGPEREPAAPTAPAVETQTVPQTAQDSDGNRYFVVMVPQRVVSGRDCGRCGACQRSFALTASLRHFLLTTSEFFPWVAGFVIIYYSYCWWGMGSGFTAFLFMIGAHAVLRLIKTHGVLSCVPYSSQTHIESDAASEDEEEAETSRQLAAQGHRIDWSAEKPPSYEIAVVKPPPYDLQYHLTPKQFSGDSPDKPHDRSSTGFLTVPARLQTEMRTLTSTVDENDSDISLPSYHDAMKHSLYYHGDEYDQRAGDS